MARLRHRLAHFFGLNSGKIECWTEIGVIDGPHFCLAEVLMVGYRCDTCGELTGVHEARCGYMPPRGEL